MSDDKLTYTFELRDGMKFSDGADVTAADCVASVRRWAARSGGGQTMMKRVKDTPVVDDKTFKIVLSEPYGLVIDTLSTISTSLCYMMRKKDAETDPNQQIRETIGSGPFLYNRDETRPGNRHVYDRNPNYVPRKEPPSAMAGGKVVKLDRVTFENIADEQTALSALQAGEIDFYEVPPQDLVDDLKKDPNLTVQVLNKTGHVALMRLNQLYPPFNNSAACQAMLYLVKQDDVMRAIFGQSKSWQACDSFFACGTPMTNHENTEWFKHGQDIGKAKELFAKAGYDGKPVVVLQATDHYLANPGRTVCRAMAASGRHQCRSRRDGLGRAALAPRREEAAGRRRLEHLFHHRHRHHVLRSDPVHRPGGEWRQGLVWLADQRSAGDVAREMGDRADAGRAQSGRAGDAEERLGVRAAPDARANSSAIPPGARTSPA